MKVVVAIKQVYDPLTVRVSRSRGILDTRGASLILNPGDRHALEEALALKDQADAHVVAVSMGPPEAEDILREALAMGVDEAVLLTGEAFASVDSSAAVMIVGEAINKIGAYDLILTGYRGLGDGSGEFAPRLAQYLGLPQIVRARQLAVGDGKLTARRTLSAGYAVLEAQLPAVVSVDEGANVPRHPSLPGSISAYEENTVTVWGAEDVGLAAETVQQSVRTQLRTSSAGPERERGRVISGDAQRAARELLQELKTKGLIEP
jgi:electron transfer flavoprotein alpha/beta subunit